MELLLALYALVVLQLEPEPIPDAFKQLRSKGVQHYFNLVPGLEEAIKNFLKGGEDFGTLPAGLRSFIKEYEKRPTAKVSVVSLLKAFTSWMLTGNENSFKRLEQAAAAGDFPAWINQNFASNVVDQGPISVKLKTLVKKMSGGKRDSTGFATIDEAKAAKEKYPDLYAQFMELRKQYVKSWKASMADFVRESGKKTVPYQDLLKFFKKNSIGHNMPEGFTGKVDAVGKWYSAFDELLTNVPSTAVFPSVRMNPNYKKGSTEYVCVGLRADGTESGYIYTTTTKKGNTLEKFSKVQDFSHIVKSVRSKWVQNITKGEPSDLLTVASTVLELLYQFSARIGSRPAEHNGISSLTVGNYAQTSTGFILKYLGKDQVPTRHVFRADDRLSHKIADIVHLLASNPDKKKKDFLFTYNLKTGSFKLVQAGVVTKVFRQCGAGSLSVHKLRTFHATQLMNKELEKVYGTRKSFKNTKEALEVLKKLAMKVGKDLNHVRRNALGESTVTPNTALANYIDVTIQVGFFQHYGLPVPTYLEKYVNSPEKLMGFSYLASESEDPTDEEYQIHADQSEDENDSQEHERKSELDAEDQALKLRLEKDAEKIGKMLTKGGDTNDTYAPDTGNFDNVLI